MSEELVTVAREISALNANLVRLRLEADGIRCFMAGEILASVVGSPSSMGNEISIQVQAFDAAAARRILREIREAPRDDEEDEKWVKSQPNLAVKVVRGLLVGGAVGGAIGCAAVRMFGVTNNAMLAANAGVFVVALICGFQFKNSFKRKR